MDIQIGLKTLCMVSFYRKVGRSGKQLNTHQLSVPNLRFLCLFTFVHYGFKSLFLISVIYFNLKKSWLCKNCSVLEFNWRSSRKSIPIPRHLLCTERRLFVWTSFLLAERPHKVVITNVRFYRPEPVDLIDTQTHTSL